MGFLTWWGTMMEKVTILHINLMIQGRPLLKICLLSLTKMAMGIDQRYISHMNNVLWMICSIIYLYWNFLSQILVRCRTTTCNWKTSPVRELLCETTSRLHHITGIRLKTSFLFDWWEIYLFVLAESFQYADWDLSTKYKLQPLTWKIVFSVKHTILHVY